MNRSKFIITLLQMLDMQCPNSENVDKRSVNNLGAPQRVTTGIMWKAFKQNYAFEIVQQIVFVKDLPLTFENFNY